MGVGVFYPISEILNDNVVSNFLQSNKIAAWYSRQDFNQIVYNPFMPPTEGCFVYFEKIYNSSLEFLGIITFSMPERCFFHMEDADNDPCLTNY